MSTWWRFKNDSVKIHLGNFLGKKGLHFNSKWVVLVVSRCSEFDTKICSEKEESIKTVLLALTDLNKFRHGSKPEKTRTHFHSKN